MIQRVDIQPLFRFSVKVDDMALAAFTEFSLPSLDVETEDIKEGGQNTYIHRLPVRVKTGNITLRNGITHGGILLDWYLEVLNGKVKDATRQVTVTMYDVALLPLLTWTFRNAYPIKWSGPTLKTSENAIAIEAIEFVHHGFEIE